jgi:hypothetical protein
MVAPFPTAPATLPPPDLPNDPSVSPTLTNYLRTFALWARQSLAGKVNSNVALPGLMLQSINPPPGQPPKVFYLQVLDNGNFQTTQINLGGGNAPR